MVFTCCADSGASQQRDVKKEKQGAMNTIMQDGMRVTAANRQAWIEICQCPLSLVCSLCCSIQLLCVLYVLACWSHLYFVLPQHPFLRLLWSFQKIDADHFMLILAVARVLCKTRGMANI